MAVLAVAISLFYFPPYLSLVPDAERIPLDPGFPDRHALAIALHAVPSGLALLVGPFQFVAPLRRRHLKAHRWVGRFYLVCAALGALVILAAAAGTFVVRPAGSAVLGAGSTAAFMPRYAAAEAGGEVEEAEGGFLARNPRGLAVAFVARDAPRAS